MHTSIVPFDDSLEIGCCALNGNREPVSDAISVDVEGRNVFTGELVNAAMCSALEVEPGRDYVIEMTALNGTGFKGACNFADVNTGEIQVSGLNVDTQVWSHRGGAGSRARIVVSSGVPPSITRVPAQSQTPTEANWTITTFAGTGKRGCSGDGGSALEAALGWVRGVAVDGAGNLYITDGDRVQKLVAP